MLGGELGNFVLQSALEVGIRLVKHFAIFPHFVFQPDLVKLRITQRIARTDAGSCNRNLFRAALFVNFGFLHIAANNVTNQPLQSIELR